ncbi:MAG: CubicO group peptidase (beta-lactamase class C family) [Cyclobacteriaceae bacterium]|jgi:CubicO group peptidase (beta-lactamase class C family)
MKQSPPFLLFFTIITLFTFVKCSDKESKIEPISGQVVDAYNQDPVENVRVQLLENGPVTFTDANGNFQFSAADLGSQDFEVVLNGADLGAALSLSSSGYRPRESNVFYDEKAIIKFTRDSVPSYVYYPPVQLNDGIETADMSTIGMDRQIIQNLMDKMYAFKYKQVHSLLVYKDDHLVMEEYFYGNNDTIQFENNITRDRNPEHIFWTRTTEHYVASVNKALTGTIVGIALNEKGLPVNTKIAAYLPEYASHFDDANKAEIAFEDCLTMTAGLSWDEWGKDDLSLLWKSDDFAKFALSRAGYGPGFEWRYNSALPNILLKAVTNIVDAPVRDWAQEHFYGKLGIEDYKWQSQPDGFPEGAARMYIRPRDMLKVGVTYLNGGKWNGEQVIPASWVQECFKVKEETTSGDYSYYFWLRSLNGVNYLSADGDGGNYINIFPDQNMVIVITQGNYLEWPGYVNQADEIMKNHIFEAIK